MANAGQMQLCDYLSVPYLLEARLVELSPGIWINQVSYPELPDCSAQSPLLEAALRQLERQRIIIVARLLAEGKVPPMPRPPLGSTDPLWIAEQSDVPTEIIQCIRNNTAATISPA
ncbi:hypothetical protein [Bradyrhizobium sp. LHD-71]|uniref:hypothetical protein n=1 Tax=Bradyrhizobium sp. LHD-71 TaxID=3072141 RepID=UPI00280FA71C|nr:hypothetical protein [Bradyrhizobium sp. LHD-71]MDQ8727107.1 hypothetical protein [Bradyrhizobium sp. LHD-71]